MHLWGARSADRLEPACQIRPGEGERRPQDLDQGEPDQPRDRRRAGRRLHRHDRRRRRVPHRQTWAADTLAALQHYHVIQPWSYCYDLGPKGEHIQTHRSFANLFYAKGASGIEQGPNGKPYYEFGHPGYAWAYTRQALEWVGGLVETAALGAADHHMALALVGKVGNSIPGNLTDGYKAPLYQWQGRAMPHIAGHIGALSGTIEHAWHGPKDKRAYVSRWDILHRNKFDPRTDMKRNTFGVMELAGNKPQLSHDIDAYFRSRDEDANSI